MKRKKKRDKNKIIDVLMQIPMAAGRLYIKVNLNEKELLYGELYFRYPNSFHFANFKLKAFMEQNALSKMQTFSKAVLAGILSLKWNPWMST